MYLEIFEAAEEASPPPVTKNRLMRLNFRQLAFKVYNLDSKLKENPDGRINEISQGYRDQENP